jgi:hypothetical protein
MPAATFGHTSHARFLISGMPMTVQHVVHEPQDFPGTTAGAEAAFQSSANCDTGGTGAPARLAALRFASPIWMSGYCYIDPGLKLTEGVLASSMSRRKLAQ